MAQPVVPPPIEPTPFDRPPGRPAPAGPGGCGKPVMIGCAALLVVFGILAILFVANAQRFSGLLLHWSLGQLQTQVLAKLPPDVTPAERDRLQAAFRSALAAIDAGKMDPQRLPQIQSEVMDIARRPQGQVTRQDVQELTEVLEGLAAGPAPGQGTPRGGAGRPGAANPPGGDAAPRPPGPAPAGT